MVQVGIYFQTFEGNMKYLILLLALVSSTEAQAWSKHDTYWEAAYLAIHVLDWGQTRDIARSNGYFYESNVIMGLNPTIKEVNTYFAVTGILHVVTAVALPRKYRRIFQASTMAWELGYVSGNAMVKIEVDFN